MGVIYSVPAPSAAFANDSGLFLIVIVIVLVSLGCVFFTTFANKD